MMEKVKVFYQKIDRRNGENRREAERRAVSECLEAAGLTSEIGHLSSGAPFLINEDEYKISISHSEEWAVIAVGGATDGRFGIDVEKTDRKQLENVARRILSNEELETAVKMENGFAKAWTAKEAVFKAVGNEGVNFIDDIKLYGSQFERAGVPKLNVCFTTDFCKISDTQLVCLAEECNKLDFETL